MPRALYHADHLLGDRMLDLDPRVELEKDHARVVVGQVLHQAHVEGRGSVVMGGDGW